MSRLTLATLVALPLAGALFALPFPEPPAPPTPPTDTNAALAEKVVVPLSQPGKPAHLSVGLINGGIRVEGWDGKEVVISATARQLSLRDLEEEEAEEERERRRDKGRRDDRDTRGMIRIPSQSLGLAVEEDGNEVEIETESWRQPIDLEVKVPRDSTLDLTCINDGDIEVRDVRGEMELANTNGAISVNGAAAPVVAETVNGDITIAWSRLETRRPLAMSTLNGSIELTLPASFKAELVLRTDNGEIFSDFPIAFADSPVRRQESREGGRFRVEIERVVRGTINGGGPELSLKTFNGDILLRKGS